MGSMLRPPGRPHAHVCAFVADHVFIYIDRMRPTSHHVVHTIVDTAVSRVVTLTSVYG